MIMFDYTLYKILLGTSLVGITTGILGCFTILNRQSLLGDTIAHATLPGITSAFLIMQYQSYLGLLTGAFLSGLCGAFCVHAITEKTKLSQDSALGIVLSTFFGLGIIFLTMIQKTPSAHQAGLDKFIFGQAATLLMYDIYILFAITMIVFLTIIYYWKELTIVTFDKQYAQSIGILVKKIDLILIILITLTIIVGLQTVGLILISSFLITPALAARQWTSSLLSMIIVSCMLSLAATSLGTYLSYAIPHVPTGPCIVIISTIITFISMIIKSVQN